MPEDQKKPRSFAAAFEERDSDDAPVRKRDFVISDLMPPPAYDAVAHRPDGKPIQDLGEKLKIVLLNGFGGSGKTWWGFTMASILAGRGAEMGLVAMDENATRELANRLPGVAQPKPGEPPDQCLERMWATVKKHRLSVIGDLGHGSGAVTKLLARRPKLVEELDADGIALVMVYPMGPLPTRAMPTLATMQALGLKPHATLLVENQGVLAPGQSTEDFAAVRREEPYKRAIAEGAAVVGMPRLDAKVVARMDAADCSLVQARDRIGPGLELPPFDSSAVRNYLDRFAAWHAPVQAWMPT